MSNEVIYIPEYVEQGVSKLQKAKTILAQIEACINSGLASINASGYNRGIPHIEKGTNESSDISSLESTIGTITTEIQRYSNGEALELESAIIIADPATISKYGLKKEDIDYTLSEYILKSDKVTSNPTIQEKWKSGYLTGGAGTVVYTGADGRLTKETWCDLNPNNLAKLMREKHGIELDYWIREDGVYMYGDYVMVAADIPHMDGTEQAAEYRKGDLVQTSLGTGMVVDLCGMAELTRKGQTDYDVWYDIYTDWHGAYSHVGYCTDAGCTDSSHTNPKSKMIRKAENPTTINPRTGQPISSGFVFNSNTTATTTPSTDTTQTTTTKETQAREETETTTQTNNTYVSNTTATTPSTTTNSGTYTTNTTNSNSTFTTNVNTNKSTNSSYTPSTSTSSSYNSGSNYNSSSGSNSYYSSGASNSFKPTTSTTTSQIKNLTSVNGFSKPVSNTTTTTPQVSTPVVNNPVVSTPVINQTPQPEVNNTPSVPSTSDQILTPGEDINNVTDIIDTTPTPIVPDIPEVDDTINIMDTEDVPVEKVPVTTPADTPINNNSNNGPIVAALAAVGVAGAGIGAKIYLDKKKENQDNGENDEYSEEE